MSRSDREKKCERNMNFALPAKVLNDQLYYSAEPNPAVHNGIFEMR